MKTKEELNVLKEEYETLRSKLSELSEEELRLVTGGIDQRDEQILNGAVLPLLSDPFIGERRPG